MSDPRPDHLTGRYVVLALLFAMALAGLVVRIARIQITDRDRYIRAAALAEGPAEEARGTILDSTNHPLALSIDAWDVYLDSNLWRDRERAATAAAELASALGLDTAAVLSAGTAQQAGDVLLMRQLSYAEGLALEERGLWGVRLARSWQRIYPEGDLASLLVGYVGVFGNGLWGIEADYDAVLRGRPGRSAGGDVRLTIDRGLQALVERHLDAALEEYSAPSGSIIVMEPHTGAILAMASRPSIALSSLDLNDPALPDLVRNRAVTDLYEPGSVFKTLTAAAALDLGLVTPDSTYTDLGRVEIGGYVIKNWDHNAYGEVTVTELLQRSLNTGAVWLATEIGAERFYPYLRAFGIGDATHVGLGGEAEGIVRTPEDDDWYPVDLATNSFGQGLAATPLQVLAAVNVFANGGVLVRPHITSEIVTGDSVRVFEPVQVRAAVSPETARTVAELMRQVVEGTARHRARVPGYQVAGKTGTTLVSIPTGYDLDSTIASFAGFLPYESPRVSILVKIDQPGGERTLGGEVAAPVFSSLAAEIMQYLDVPADAPALAARSAEQAGEAGAAQ